MIYFKGMETQFSVGQLIHIDTDNKEWGRVAEDATIIEIQKKNLLVNAHGIRANILVPFKDANPKG